MAIYITGDCHGDYRKIQLFCRNYSTSKDDIIIILGDVGINYWLTKIEKKIKKRLENLPITLFCVHGNHEARPYTIDTYKEIAWHGGMVYQEPQYPSLLFAKDGEIYELGDKKAIVIGGAYSVDKEYRIRACLPWYKDEQPSNDIKKYVENKLKDNHWTVAYVLSHTCPKKYMPEDLFLEFINQEEIDNSTEEWMSDIEKKMHYEKWYFGHFHGNRTFFDAEMLYEGIKELGHEDFMQKLGYPLYNMRELVVFEYDCAWGKDELYGRIAAIDKYGTSKQRREVSYDIHGIDGTIYKQVLESAVDGIKEC